MRTLVLGTRGSPLALRQSELVLDLLHRRHPGRRFERRILKTAGDTRFDPLPSGTGIFVKELQAALLRKEIDFAAHSFKDLPTKPTAGLGVPAVLPREDPRDMLLSREALRLAPGRRIGTGSLRRRAFLLAAWPGLDVRPLRGNIDTRIRRLLDGTEFDGIVLAGAGLRRLYKKHLPCRHRVLPLSQCPPAPAQGAIAVEAREEDADVQNVLAALHHPATAVCVGAERGILSALHGGCNVPLGAFAKLERGRLTLTCRIASLDGRTVLQETVRGTQIRSAELVDRLAQALLARGASRILKEARAT